MKPWNSDDKFRDYLKWKFIFSVKLLKGCIVIAISVIDTNIGNWNEADRKAWWSVLIDLST